MSTAYFQKQSIGLLTPSVNKHKLIISIENINMSMVLKEKRFDINKSKNFSV